MKILLITMKEADKDLQFHIESQDFIPFLKSLCWWLFMFLPVINPSTLIGDQDRISPYNISTENIIQTSDKNKDKYQLRVSLVDPRPNSPN